MAHPLVNEVIRKAAIAWLTVEGTPTYPVWCLGIDGALYVVTGPGEQPAPGLTGATDVLVTARGDHGGRIVTWPARVSRLWPGTADWETVTPQLAAKRLNAPGPAEGLIARWADGCAVIRLAPAGEPVEAGPTLPAASGAAPPRDTPAARPTPRPFRLHRVRPRN